ncbi:hypothetical protein [Thioalkalivibrio sp. ALMg9]|uniref:hypothetical protein n=1 Tax=Thioalkalivibrio sp. ALMg9 TaxID=1266912 RepID=UPI00036807AA|nr:hypothetical protein [Thioalkalivibrio sp. ALMg9]
MSTEQIERPTLGGLPFPVPVVNEACRAEIAEQIRRSAEAREPYDEMNAKVRAIKARHGYGVSEEAPSP